MISISLRQRNAFTFSAFVSFGLLLLNTALAQTNSTDKPVAAITNSLSTNSIAITNSASDSQFQARWEALQKQMHGLPDNMNEVLDAARALEKDFPNHDEGFRVMLVILNHAEETTAEPLAKELVASAAPENIKQQARIFLRLIPIMELIEGLPDTRAKLETAAQQLVTDFPESSVGYQVLLKVLRQSEGDEKRSLANKILTSTAPEPIKQAVRIDLSLEPVKKLLAKLPDSAAETEAAGRQLLKDFPESDVGYQILFAVLQQSDGTNALALATELANSPAPKDISIPAASLLKTLAFVGKPLDLRFTAIDGREVNVASLTNKVVIVDFWATWCPPCMAELPALKALYTKFHDSGLEVIGISLDDDKAQLDKVLKIQKIPWPQFYDGLHWKNKYAVQFSIGSSPTYFLVDKKGILRGIKEDNHFESQIVKLLAEK